MQNGSFTGVPNDFGWLLTFRVMDPFGVPVANTPVSFQILSGGGKFNAAGGDKTTDVLGNAGVFVDLGPSRATRSSPAPRAGCTQRFDGSLRRLPSIKSSGVVNAAPPTRWVRDCSRDRTFRSSAAISPTPTLVETTPSLPVSLGQVSVSFDGGGKSLPGHIHFISPGTDQRTDSLGVPGTIVGPDEGDALRLSLGRAVHSAAGHLFAGDLRRHGRRHECRDLDSANPTAIRPNAAASIVIYANGLGPVSAPQSSGEPASSTQLVGTNAAPTVTIGGSTATGSSSAA